MPAYPAAQPASLSPGTSIALVNNAAVDSNITTTAQFALPPNPVGTGVTLIVVNTTNQQATGQFATTDTAANYEPLSSLVVGSNVAYPYNLTPGWVRFTFATAPTSGSLIVSR